jgi:hypothetical protein
MGEEREEQINRVGLPEILERIFIDGQVQDDE